MVQFTELRERLLRQAYLFDAPQAYEAGVNDALDAMLELQDGFEYPMVTIDLTRDRPSLRVTSA